MAIHLWYRMWPQTAITDLETENRCLFICECTFWNEVVDFEMNPLLFAERSLNSLSGIKWVWNEWVEYNCNISYCAKD